jgi:hypothetical protein
VAIEGRIEAFELPWRACLLEATYYEPGPRRLSGSQLFELDCDGQQERAEVFARYGEALVAFEQGGFSNSARILGDLLNDFPGDGPALVLLSRAVDAMVKEPSEPPIVWELPGK